MYFYRRLYISLFLIFCVSGSMRIDVSAQVRPVYDRGRTGLLQKLEKLNTTASVLMIGAHPDDEDTSLLAYLARGENARTAYLSLTRGDGGQNIIGTELGEALGVVRTEELLQARTLDGAEQFFTRAYDYGFSKTLAEAKQKWDEQTILCDAVQVIRAFKPLVVVSQFSGTSADGHGQHQFAGYISPLAVKAAADPSQCASGDEPWTVRKFYYRHRGQDEPTLRINTGKYDALLGRTYFEIAMEARSQHKSQEQGVLELRGDQFSSLKLAGSDAKETSIFQGLEFEQGSHRFDLNDNSRLLKQLTEIYPTSSRKALVADAIASVSGLEIDALADAETVAAGESVGVGVKAFVQTDEVKVKDISLVPSIAPERWTIVSEELPKANSPAFVLRESTPNAQFFRATPSKDVWRTQPYWLMEDRKGDVFEWSGMSWDETMPFERRPLVARVSVEVYGNEIVFEREVQYRFADDIRGEVRRNVDVVPAATVDADEPLIIIPSSASSQVRTLSFTVTNHSTKPAKGKPSIAFDQASGAWSGKAKTTEVSLDRRGSKTSFTYDVMVPANAKPGRYTISGDVLVDGKYYGLSMRTVSYPHIHTRRFYKPATAIIQIVDLKTTKTKIGYIVGSGDRVQDAIRQMGMNVETISESELANGDLSRFDTIVVGVRAYQVRADIVSYNQRLLDYVRNGGNLIVQYQLPPYGQQYAPIPAQQGVRVADENAAMKLLLPEHPYFNSPNKISDRDFEGWVQERNLHNFSNLSSEYTGLIESHDGGEAENSGGLVVAKIGKGNYVYCSYSFFRQLPAGVPGAYRLFANMLSQPRGGGK